MPIILPPPYRVKSVFVILSVMKKISCTGAPKAIGPYSQAIAAGDFLFVSGQLPMDPTTGELIPGDIEALTHQTIDNLAAILKAAGLSLAHVVKTEVFLLDMADFQAMNRAYGERFSTEPTPARAAIQVAGLPRGARIEIACIACRC